MRLFSPSRLVHFLLLLSSVGTTGYILDRSNHANAAEQWAQKMFPTTHHDFGTVSRNAKTEYAFEVENCFEEDVHIVSVRSSCSCTQPILAKNTLRSGEKTKIVAQFNTRSFLGTKSAAINVVIDRPYYAEVQLTVGGTIRSDIVVEPGEIKFGDVDVGTSKTIDLKVSYAGRRDWKIADVRGNSDILQVKLDPVSRNGNLTSYVLHVKLRSDADVGELQEEIVVVTDDDRDETFTLPVSARIVPPISISPSVVVLGEVRVGQKRQQQIVVRGKSPFSITGIECDDDRVAFDIPPGEKSVHVLPIVFTARRANANEGAVKRKILIRTSMGALTAEATLAGRVID